MRRPSSRSPLRRFSRISARRHIIISFCSPRRCYTATPGSIGPAPTSTRCVMVRTGTTSSKRRCPRFCFCRSSRYSERRPIKLRWASYSPALRWGPHGSWASASACGARPTRGSARFFWPEPTFYGARCSATSGLSPMFAPSVSRCSRSLNSPESDAVGSSRFWLRAPSNRAFQ